jgi:hypothetical protein
MVLRSPSRTSSILRSDRPGRLTNRPVLSNLLP